MAPNFRYDKDRFREDTGTEPQGSFDNKAGGTKDSLPT